MADVDETRIALIGAGDCAHFRLDLWLSLRGARVVAVVSSDLAAAERLAAQAPGARAFATAYEMLKVGGVDLVHVLVPFGERAKVVRAALASGVACLCNGVPAASAREVKDLYALAERSRVPLGVESAWRSHPLVRTLAQELVSGRLGRIESLQLLARIPEAQDHTDQSDPAGSDRERLLEAVAEPLLLAADLLGPLELHPQRDPSGAGAGGGAGAAPRSLAFAGQGPLGSTQIGVVLGGGSREGLLTAVCRDGVVQIDLARDRLARRTSSKGSVVLDLGQALTSWVVRVASRMRPGPAAARLGLSRGLATVLSDAVTALKDRRPFRPGAAPVIAVSSALEECDGVRLAAPGTEFVPPPPLAPRPGEIVVCGQPDGAGRALVELLLDKGQPTTLFVPHAGTLPRELRDPRLRIVSGNATDARAAEAALGGAAFVVVLGTAPLGAPAEAAALALGMHAFARGVTRLVLVSCAATLPVGQDLVLRGDSDPDIRIADRAPDVRSWAAAERALRGHARHVGLDVVVLRPGLVVGRGCQREHPGVGDWTAGSVCTGYGMGQHPLPFVLASDVARAIVAALFTRGIDGRAYNLAGDVKMSAHEYIVALGKRQERGYRFRPVPLLASEGVAAARELVALAFARRGEQITGHEVRCRAFLARLDGGDAKRDLAWWPCADRERFLDEAMPRAATASTRDRSTLTA